MKGMATVGENTNWVPCGRTNFLSWDIHMKRFFLTNGVPGLLADTDLREVGHSKTKQTVSAGSLGKQGRGIRARTITNN